jgi:hypothetical protein
MVRKLLAHSAVSTDGDQIPLTNLRLLGLLLCASTKKMKAELFYEIVLGYNPKERQ